MKKTLKFIGLFLFFAALILLLYIQNPRAELYSLFSVISFALILFASASCFVGSELLKKTEDLEKRVFDLEEEIRKIKGEKSNDADIRSTEP